MCKTFSEPSRTTKQSDRELDRSEDALRATERARVERGCLGSFLVNPQVERAHFCEWRTPGSSEHQRLSSRTLIRLRSCWRPSTSLQKGASECWLWLPATAIGRRCRGLGFATLLEPAALIVLGEKIRADVAETIRYFEEQGVAVKVISGDHVETVQAVADLAGVRSEQRAFDARNLPADPTGFARLLTNTACSAVSPPLKSGAWFRRCT